MARLLFVSLLGLQGALALSPFTTRSKQESSPVAFVNPSIDGGSQIDVSPNLLRQPLNVIISGASTPAVLSKDGFAQFASAIGFVPAQDIREPPGCTNLCLSDPREADLGDGKGLRNETLAMRQEYLEPDTLPEKRVGDDLWLFSQNGTDAHTNALFLGLYQWHQDDDDSLDGSVSLKISPNGFDVGRDFFVSGALGLAESYWQGYQVVNYQVDAKNITGLIPPGYNKLSDGISTDGVVVLLTVEIVP